MTYHTSLPDIGGILKELHRILQMSDKYKQAVPTVPMMVFRRPEFAGLFGSSKNATRPSKASIRTEIETTKK